MMERHPASLGGTMDTPEIPIVPSRPAICRPAAGAHPARKNSSTANVRIGRSRSQSTLCRLREARCAGAPPSLAPVGSGYGTGRVMRVTALGREQRVNSLGGPSANFEGVLAEAPVEHRYSQSSRDATVPEVRMTGRPPYSLELQQPFSGCWRMTRQFKAFHSSGRQEPPLLPAHSCSFG